MRRFEVDNVRVVLEKSISIDGKIVGLKDWANRKATIIIQDNNDSKSNRKKDL